MDPQNPETTPEQTTSAEQFNSSSFFKEHLKRTEDGSLEIVGTDLGPMEMALLETEKRRRGSQASSAREKARADKYKNEIGKVKTGIRDVRQPDPIDPTLKVTDPDEYIRLTIEAQQHDPYKEMFDTASQQAAQETGQQTIESIIAQHNQVNPDRVLSQDMLEMDLPPRLVNDFTEGKMSSSDFLSRAAEILYRPTATSPQTMGQPDLGNVGGQTTPTDTGSNDKMLTNYGQAII